MMSKEWAEKICRGCLGAIPEKDREACLQNLQKIFQPDQKGNGICCHSHFKSTTTKSD